MDQKKTDWKLVLLLLLLMVVLPAVIVVTVMYHERIMAYLKEMKEKLLPAMPSAKKDRDEEKTITIELGGR